MSTLLNGYVTDDVDDDDDDDDDDDEHDFGYDYKDNMIAQIKQNLYNKNFSLQDQGKCVETDTLQKRKKIGPNVIDVGGTIPDNVYDYDYNIPGIN